MVREDHLRRVAGPTTAAYVDHAAANLLRLGRNAAGLSQRELAELSGVAQSTIARIETSKMQPTLPTLQLLMISMGQEIRMRVATFDDHDRVLDRRAAVSPERHRQMEERRDALLEQLHRGVVAEAPVGR